MISSNDDSHPPRSDNVNVFSFNCHGFKSSHDMILQQLKLHDIVFICEHWLKPGEVSLIESELISQKYWCYLKSSIDPECVLQGRPFGGVGFICNRKADISYKPIKCENDRISGMQLINGGTVILNIFGIYLPYYDGTTRCTCLYSETLNDLQAMIDITEQSPIMIVGDSNTSLPKNKYLRSNWYKTHPFNRHSYLLYEFLLTNDLHVADFTDDQPVNYTFHSGALTSYVDHVFISNHAQGSVKKCRIMHDLIDNVSDHFPISTNVTISVRGNGTSLYINSLNHSCPPTFPKIDWTNREIVAAYREHVIQGIHHLKLPYCLEISNPADAQTVIDETCDSITSILHDSAKKAVTAKTNRSTYRGKHQPKRWWNSDCGAAKDRQRLWHRIWTSCGRPRNGHIYKSYKLAKNSYRTACRNAVNTARLGAHLRLDHLFASRNTKKFWNAVRNYKRPPNDTSNDISLETLTEYFINKFSNVNEHNNTNDPFIMQTKREVAQKAHDLENYTSGFVCSERKLTDFIEKLKLGCSAGIDGIQSEHLKFTSDTGIIKHISKMLTLCFRFGIVPKSSTRGLLIPVLKKPTLDPTLPKNYRPIVISTTFSKLIEHFILERSKAHEFSDLQFGFIEGRGTTMAAALAHDVIQHCTSQDTPVFACSLDAEGAFDAIPHSVLFQKISNILPDDCWKLLYKWYSHLAVCVRWSSKIGSDIKVNKGTRQGGLSSPFLFNIFYQDLIDELSHLTGGIIIGGKSYNVFCYADDILLTSVTVTGLQMLIDHSNNYITKHGLRFNPGKTQCISFGKSTLINRKWTLNNEELKQVKAISYLGITLSNSPEDHVEERIQATRRAFHAFQAAGLCVDGLNPDTIAYIWKTALQPILLYGTHTIKKTKNGTHNLERTQSKLIKATFGLSKFCHITPLLKALRIHPISCSIECQGLSLLKSIFESTSRCRAFYTHAIKEQLAGKRTSCNLIESCISTCRSNRISLPRYLIDDNYSKACQRHLKAQDRANGIVDSVRQCLYSLDSYNRNLLNLLLMPF